MTNSRWTVWFLVSAYLAMDVAGSPSPPVVGTPKAFLPGTAQMRPHEGMVFIDDTREGQVLTNIVTHTRQVLDADGAPWHLEFDEDGFGAIVASCGEQFILLEQCMATTVFDAPNGIVLTRSRDDSTSGYRMVNLTDKMTEFTVRAGIFICLDTAWDLVAYKVPWARGSSRILWGALELYAVFDLSSFKKKASKWLYESIGSWRKTLAGLGLTGHVFKSNSSVTRAEALVTLDAFTPTPAITTVAILVLGTRWAHAVPALGGFRVDDSRRRAKALVAGFVATSHVRPFDMDIGVASDWLPVWPRPCKLCVENIRLPVDAEGFVDMKSLTDLLDEDSAAVEARFVARQWWEVLRGLRGDNGKFKLVDLFNSRGVALDETIRGLWLQVVMQVAARIEAILYLADRKEIDGSLLPLHLEELSEEDGRWSCREVDKTCLVHVTNCTAACKGPLLYWGIAVDKASVRGLSLHNGFMVLPSNIGFELIPQVARGDPPHGGNENLEHSG
jgi:hypothetical protein